MNEPRGNCRQCGEEVVVANLRLHLSRGCGPRRALQLLEQRFRPFPADCTVPLSIPHVKAITPCPYEGEPREQFLHKRGLEAEPQLWFPFWVDLVVTLWARHIGLHASEQDLKKLDEARSRALARDRVLATLAKDPQKGAAVEAAWRMGGMPAVAEYLRAFSSFVPKKFLEAEVISGPPR